MKNSKVCFNKSIGVLIVVIVALSLFTVFAFQLTTKPTSTSTRASASAKNTLPILDGEKAKDGEFPFHATLFTKEGWLFCGGTLINKYWVLTAAHCINGVIAYDGNIEGVRVVIGLDHLDRNLKALHYSKVDKFYVHEKFDDKIDKTKNDIGLLHLETPAEGIPTASLYYYHKPIKGRNNISADYLEEYLEDLHKPITIIGYGGTVADENNPKYPYDLMKKTNGFKIITEVDLARKYGFYIEPMYTFSGDSGSPVLTFYQDRMNIVGLDSTGNSNHSGVSNTASGRMLAVQTRIC